MQCVLVLALERVRLLVEVQQCFPRQGCVMLEPLPGADLLPGAVPRCAGPADREPTMPKAKLHGRERGCSVGLAPPGSKAGGVGPTGAAGRALRISGWSRGEGMRRAAAGKVPGELIVEPRPPLQRLGAFYFEKIGEKTLQYWPFKIPGWVRSRSSFVLILL